MLTTFLTPAIGFLVTVAFGFWLGRSGKPYNGILFNLHKLIALGTVIMISVQLYESLRVLGPQSLIIILVVVAAICVVTLFASGAFMSTGTLNQQTMKTIHNIAPVLFGLVVGLMFYLIGANPQ